MIEGIEQSINTDILSTLIDMDKYPEVVEKVRGQDEKVNTVGRVARVIEGVKRLPSSIHPERDIAPYMNENVWCRYRELATLFKVGGLDIHHMPEECTLRFKTSDSNTKEFKDLLSKVSMSWSLPYDLNHRFKWDRITRFLADELLCPNVCKREVRSINGYEISFKWIWSDVLYSKKKIYVKDIDEPYIIDDLFYQLNDVPPDVIQHL